MGDVSKEEADVGVGVLGAKEGGRDYPKFITIGWAGQRTHEELGEGTPLFSNEGFVRIQLAASLFTSLLHEEGLSSTFINGIRVVFRPAYLADRDFFGEPLGGVNVAGSGLIEVYTTLLAEQVGARHTHIPVHKRTIVLKLLHELGHEIEIEQGGQPAGSFILPGEERRRTEGERRARQFAQDHFHHFVNKLLIEEESSFPLLDNADPRIVGDLGDLGEWLDLGRRIEVWEKDWPPLDIRGELKSKFLGPKDIPTIPPEEFKEFLEKARALVEERWLGIIEYNYMVRCLQIASTDKGSFPQWVALEGEIIKPDEVAVIVERAGEGKAVARINLLKK